MNALGVAFLTLGTATFMMTTIRAIHSLSQLGTRVRYRDGLYFVAVRNPGEWHELREFVQPDITRVCTDAWGCLDWVCKNIDYRLDIGEFFQFPSETLITRRGDCEDSSILLTSLLKAKNLNAYVVLGEYQGWGHAWVISEGEILEATYTQAKPVPDPEDYCVYVMFNNDEVIEMWPGALAEVFSIARSEQTKLNLLQLALGT